MTPIEYLGQHYLSTEIQWETPSGNRYSIVVINLGRKTNQNADPRLLDPHIDHDQQRGSSRRDSLIFEPSVESPSAEQADVASI
ncbi:MAG: hypothetical protein EA369_00600 [Bradymonadales bacterium]|nr:MAG: hypothetical protein EA369_00600 [Bradymonadales bacterium]